MIKVTVCGALGKMGRTVIEEIKKTARRVNALEQMVIPGIRFQIHYIQQLLDQLGYDYTEETSNPAYNLFLS
jgi:vacuolar-type H+-ATPase subunit D/Vma8